MPVGYQIYPERNLIKKTFSGRVTTREVLKILDDIEADIDYREGMMELDDLCAVTDLDITATEIAHFADLVTGLNTGKRHPSRKAVLAPHGPARVAAHGFRKLVEGAEGFDVEVFDDMAKALAYLRIGHDDKFSRSLALGLKVH